MELSWDILYRGPLDSCNYACGYCPFGKRTNTREQLADDARKLDRFVTWVGAQQHARISVLFTPWGEALVHRAYQRALVALSRMPGVVRAAIQTNLSGSLAWLAETEPGRVALWATWHPTEVSLDRFLGRCRELDAAGVRYSVGVVGLREHLEALEQLRERLSPAVYLWVNAYKDRPHYYDDALVRRITRIDPLFPLNLRPHASRGHACFAGETSFAVDGDGEITRCHFLQAPLGNLYRDDVRAILKPRACTRAHCSCHIGYVHLKRLALRDTFRAGLLERIPDAATWSGWPGWSDSDSPLPTTIAEAPAPSTR